MSDNSSQGGGSAVGQTANISRSTSVASGAAKVFREFKWGLLTLFLLMVVVVGLVYDGGKRKNKIDDPAKLPALPEIALDGGVETALPPLPPGTVASNGAAPAPGALLAPHGDAPLSQPPVIENPNFPEQTLGAAQPPAPAQTPVAATPGNSAPPQTVVAPSANPSAAAPLSGGSEKTYVVKDGDTLTKIASTQLPGKGSLKAILAANKDVLSDPNKLKVGMTLKIPAAVSATSKPAAPVANSTTIASPEVAKPTNAAAPAEYVVQSGDTLERIARKVLNDGRRWKDLFEWNREQLGDPSRLRVGQVLKLKGGSGSNARAEIVEPIPEGLPKTATTERRADVQNDIRVMSTAASLP